MFSFFKKKPKYFRLPDKVWVNTTTKYTNFFQNIQEEKTNEYLVIIVAFFKNTLNDLHILLEKFGIPFQAILNVNDFNKANTANQVYLINAELLDERLSYQNFLQVHQERISEEGIFYLFAEHYPLFDKEDNLLNLLAEYTPEPTICFHIALDEPLMKVFGSERIIALLQKMGINENESIEHSYVTNSISQAQKKLENKIKMVIEKDSPEEWFATNWNK